MVLKNILHEQMTEKIAFEVRPKKGQNLLHVFFDHFQNCKTKLIFGRTLSEIYRLED